MATTLGQSEEAISELGEVRALLAKQKESGDVSIHAIRDHYAIRNYCAGDTPIGDPRMPEKAASSSPVPL